MNYQESVYTQAVGQFEAPIGQLAAPIGSYYQAQPEQLTYPNEAGSAYLAQLGDVTSHEPMWGYGQEEPPPPIPDGGPPGMPPQTYEVPQSVKWYGGAWMVVSTASMAASAYHGYKRNQSVGWAIVWALLGGLFPVITPAIAVAQGFGKTKRGS